MEAKKISFGFSKINKRPNFITNKESNKTEAKVELIKCLEGQEIKLVEEKPEEKPLVIPVKENQKTSSALASLIKRRAVLLGEEVPDNITNEQKEQTNISNNVDVTEDLEKRAARELLAGIHSNNATDDTSALVLPVVKPDDLPLEGAKESNLDDYENIPIQDFGKAMLRGMGWIEPTKTNKKGGQPLDETPMVRPKGMGLGADKALNKKPLLVAPEANEVLEIKRNAYVRILGGKHKELYGQIEGFDDHAGRVIVKMAIGGNKEAFNEFLCQPVSKKEYAQYGKCINSNKYAEYKKMENEYGQIIVNQDEKDNIEKSYSIKNVKKEKYASPENENKYTTKDSDDYRNEKKYIKKENDQYQDYYHKREKEISSYRRDKISYNERDRREGVSIRDRQYRKDNNTENYRDFKRHESQKDYREHDRSSKEDRQQERNRDSYVERSERRKPNIVDSSSESQNDSHSSKHKKSTKTKRSKKKSKKSKSKYKSESSDTEYSSSDTDSSSSNSENERRKKFKKKTKKSKKQRERSRSRNRR